MYLRRAIRKKKRVDITLLKVRRCRRTSLDDTLTEGIRELHVLRFEFSRIGDVAA